MSEQRLRGYGIFPNPHRSCGRHKFETNCVPHLFWSYTLNSCSFKIHYIVCQSGSIQEIENTVGI